MQISEDPTSGARYVKLEDAVFMPSDVVSACGLPGCDEEVTMTIKSKAMLVGYCYEHLRIFVNAYMITEHMVTEIFKQFGQE